MLAPTVPPAPPRLSMISDLPVDLENCAASGRAKASVPPPAGNGTTMLTGLVGQPLESRYGFHVVYVDQRIEGVQLPYDAVAQDIRRELYQRVWQKAVAQYLQTLVGAADIQGINLAGADSPLVQ